VKSKVFIQNNRYVDSVTLMGVAERIVELDFVEKAECGMGTPANIELLTQIGFDVPKETGKNDLMISVAAWDEAGLNAAYEAAMTILEHRGGTREKVYRTLEDIDLHTDPFDLVQISLPGEYATAEARKALKMGLDVFIFSDNVPIEQELELKQFGNENGRLVMGPDCGVGLLGGIALGAGSIVRQGEIGIVSASGSGAQEVACLIERMGQGVSCIIGTGGRDLYPEIGGITMRMGIERLEDDPATKVICLVSKLADLAVMDSVLSLADKMKKPVVAVFLGSTEQLFMDHCVHGVFSLEAAAYKSVGLLTDDVSQLGWTDQEIEEIATRETVRLCAKQKYFRGLYCGGTFAEEALIYFTKTIPQSQLYSNLATVYADKLPSHLKSKGHTILDLGAEDFTKDEPHPVFDTALRLKRLKQELTDPQVAVVLLDFITGPGVHANPIEPFAKLCNAHRKVIFIATICGAEQDPQNIEAARKILEDAGVLVADSNYQSARLAAAIIQALDRRS